MFRGMEYVYEVYKEKSFSKAARNLYISQPSLSTAVKKAEEEIGFPVFDRSTTPIKLTEFGEEYIKSIEIIMGVEKSFENFIHDVSELKSGSISIGGTNLFASYILPPLISEFTEKYPLVDINLVEANTTELTGKLFSGNLDLLIDNNFVDETIYEKKFFGVEHLLLTVPKKLEANIGAEDYAMTAADIKNDRHLSGEVSPVPLKFFANEPFLLLKSGNDTKTRADKICHNSRFVPKVKLKLEQQITAYHLSCYGMGISFTGDILIKHVPDDENLIYYKLEDKDARRDVNFYYKKGRYMPRALKEFLNMAGQAQEPIK